MRADVIGFYFVELHVLLYTTTFNRKRVWFMVFSATFNNISVISWRSILLVKESGENRLRAPIHWQTLSHNVVSRAPRLTGFKLTTTIRPFLSLCKHWRTINLRTDVIPNHCYFPLCSGIIEPSNYCWAISKYWWTITISKYWWTKTISKYWWTKTISKYWWTETISKYWWTKTI